jgi:hypothetical protein
MKNCKWREETFDPDEVLTEFDPYASTLEQLHDSFIILSKWRTKNEQNFCGLF